VFGPTRETYVVLGASSRRDVRGAAWRHAEGPARRARLRRVPGPHGSRSPRAVV